MIRKTEQAKGPRYLFEVSVCETCFVTVLVFQLHEIGLRNTILKVTLDHHVIKSTNVVDVDCQKKCHVVPETAQADEQPLSEAVPGRLLKT
jgi:hypothetical protein